MKRHSVTTLVNQSLDKAIALHGPMRGFHEAYAVILEELDEVWEEVKRIKSNADPVTDDMVKELTHVAAMAMRALVDLCPDKETAEDTSGLWS